MRHLPISPKLFTSHRQRLEQLLPAGSLAVINANDVLPTNADGSLPLVPNSDLFYFSGIEQEESILVLAPNAIEEKHRQILFIRQPNEHLKIWEGYKHSLEDAQKISGISTVKWLSEFDSIFRTLMCDSEFIYLNTNEHKRSGSEVQTRDDRFIAECRNRYPLHTYKRLAPLMHRLRVIKSPLEVELLQQAVQITEAGFRRSLQVLKPGVKEFELEAEYAHEFTRSRAKFAYNPIIAAGANNCVLHYNQNDQTCKKGQLVLMDVAASYANYNADLTRTVPVSGRYNKRQRAVYDAVLRVMRQSIAGATVGKLHKDWTQEARDMMNEELLALSLITKSDIKKSTPEAPACRPYFMHGLGHALGLDVHDVGLMHEPMAAGWVLTVEPGIYIQAEGFGIRTENNILLTVDGPVDLMASIPVEAEEIEELMAD